MFLASVHSSGSPHTRQFGSRVTVTMEPERRLSPEHVFPLLKGPLNRPMLTEFCVLRLTVGLRAVNSGRMGCAVSNWHDRV